MSETLPTGWVETKIKTCIEIKYGKGLVKENRQQGNINVYGSNGVVGCHNNGITKGVTIIIGRKGSVGRIHLCADTCWPIDTTYYIDEFHGTNEYFLYRFLQTIDLAGLESSSAIPGINREIIYDQNITLPPLNEQKRIVAKLDSIIPCIDSVKARLEKIPVIIKRFRQSVLTAAVTGKLTERWREEHPEVESAEILLEKIRKERLYLYNQKKTSKPKNSPKINQNEIHFEINDNWAWCRISQVALKMSTGPFGSMLHKSDYASNGIPVVNPTNIIDGKITSSDKMMASKGTQQRLYKYLLFQNDIVIARRGDLSKCGIVTNNEEGWLCGTGSFFLKLGIDPTFFRFFYISDYCQSILNSDAIGSTMANLNQKLLSKIIFPLPPIEEQKEIVRQVDRLFALADKLEVHYHKAKARIDKLSQSVLAKAFRGELVPQDPDDEPAEKLLERIMAEKAKMEDGGRQKAKSRTRRTKV